MSGYRCLAGPRSGRAGNDPSRAMSQAGEAPTAAPLQAVAGRKLAVAERFINRELSWLAFNQRVSDEARNPAHPLLERLRFLSISATNLDEFFMVRVAGLHGQVRAGIDQLSDDGLTPPQQLTAINRVVADLIAEQGRTWRDLVDKLTEVGIHVIRVEDLGPDTFVTRSGNTTVKYSAGIRVLGSDMEGFWSDNIATGERITVDNEFIGAGPMLGVDITHPLFQTSTINVNVFAGGSAAMLYGERDFQIIEGNANALPLDDRAVFIEEDTTVKNAQLRFGLEAIKKPSPKSLIEYFATVGLEGQYWDGIGTIAATPDGGTDNVSDFMLDADLGLIGGTFMLGVRGEFW